MFFYCITALWSICSYYFSDFRPPTEHARRQSSFILEGLKHIFYDKEKDFNVIPIGKERKMRGAQKIVEHSIFVSVSIKL